MSKHIYMQLAASNFRKNSRFYVPFLITGILTVSMFFIVCSQAMSKTLPGGGSMQTVMFFGVIVVALFSLIFLFYTNSFLIKRRKKELGLYNILGMEKRHIASVLFCETAISAFVSLIGGLLLGLLLDRLMYLVLMKIIHYDIPMKYAFNSLPVITSVILFFVIFALLLLNNVIQIGKSKPIDLLHGGNVGEKEPKVKWVLAVLGVLCLGAGYYIAISTKDVLSALSMFFVAVLLVIFGTYFLFLAGCIAILKLLKKNKKYYYKPKHFVSVSGMLYRMKQNAAGLANICILSTMVLVTVSATVSLYAGMNDILDYRFPRDITVSLKNSADGEKLALENKLGEILDASGYKTENYVAVESLTVAFQQSGDSLTCDGSEFNIAYVAFYSPENFEKLTGQKYSLSGNEAALHVQKGKLGKSFSIMGDSYTAKYEIKDCPQGDEFSTYVANVYIMVVSDDAISSINAKQAQFYGNYASSKSFDVRFDVDGASDEQVVALYNKIAKETSVSVTEDGVEHKTFYGECKQANIGDFYQLYGGFLFLGMLVGGLFLMATVLIIYYKQIIEGYDDREKFSIMQDVGMDKKLISSSIRSQILTMFFLPIAVAAIHLAFAFPMLTRLLSAFSLTNVKLFAICTVITLIVFAVIYGLVYSVTAKSYYKIVSDKTALH